MKHLKITSEEDGYIYLKFISYKPTSIRFDVHESGTTCVPNKKEAIQLDSLIDRLIPIIDKYKSRFYELKDTPAGKIMRCNIRDADNYLSGVFMINYKNTTEQDLGEQFVDWYLNKYKEAYLFCKEFIKELDGGKITWNNMYEMDDYHRHVNYFEFKGMPTKIDIENKLGPDPLNKLLTATNKLLKDLNKHK